MQKIIIIDGYNVIHKIPELEAELDKSLESARKALAMEISGWQRRYSNAKVYIVFDGKNEDGLSHSHTKICGITCIFTRTEESADEWIIHAVRNAKDASCVTVISDDNQVRNNCRAHMAEVHHTSFLRKKNKKSRGPVRPAEKFDSKTDREITDYYEKHLRDKGII